MINLPDIKQKALKATRECYCGLPTCRKCLDDTAFFRVASPDVVLKLLRIIEVQGEALGLMVRSNAIHGESYKDEARAAIEQVSKILTEQNEGDGI